MDAQLPAVLPRYALLGDPVAHSRSPHILNAAFLATGIAARYEAIRVDPGQLVSRLRELALAGGGGNVTVPYKQLAVKGIDLPSDAVQRTGAVNTFWGTPKGVRGDNTDVEGFRAALAHYALALEECPVLLLGAGGAAAAVLLVLIEARCEVTLVNRSPARAGELAERMGAAERVHPLATPPARDYAAVINATSLGMRPGDPYPLAIDRIPPAAAVVDLVYAPDGTAWVRAARGAGHLAFDGAEMLLRQAAAAFELWTGRPAPLDVMRSAFTAPG